MRCWTSAARLSATLVALMFATAAFAESVHMLGLGVPLCGISYKNDSASRLSLRQYLSQFSVSDLDEKSLIGHLGADGKPCVRPVLQNTAISLVQRVVELGYADWDPSSGMLDLDIWIATTSHKAAILEIDVTSGNSVQAVVPPRTSIPWEKTLILVCGSCVVALVVVLAKLSPLRTTRSSIAALGVSRRTKIRGIAIPTTDALSVMSTDIRAIAYKRITRKYRHNGWQIVEAVSERVSCSIDDGTGCIDIDITEAQVHCNNMVTIYNGIPGEPVNRTPYVDDIMVLVHYIPVGAIVTVIGMLDETEKGYRAARYVQVYAGDERSEVRRLRILVLAIGCVLVFSSLVLLFLRQGR